MISLTDSELDQWYVDNDYTKHNDSYNHLNINVRTLHNKGDTHL